MYWCKVLIQPLGFWISVTKHQSVELFSCKLLDFMELKTKIHMLKGNTLWYASGKINFRVMLFLLSKFIFTLLSFCFCMKYLMGKNRYFLLYLVIQTNNRAKNHKNHYFKRHYNPLNWRSSGSESLIKDSQERLKF